MLDSTLKILKKRIFGVKTLRFCRLLRNVIMDVISGLSILMHDVISLPDATSCDNIK